MQVVVLVLHHEGGVVAATVPWDPNLTERLLQSAADLDAPHACRSLIARRLAVVALVPGLRIVNTTHSAV
jgi:hypothetical protein